MRDSAQFVLDKSKPLHGKVLERLKEYISASKQMMSNRYTVWQEAEEQFVAYMPEKELDIARKDLRKHGVPQYTTITVPYSYATAMTAHTYYSSVFLAREPVFQYQGRHGESQDSELAVESLVSYQMNAGFNLVPLYIWLLDPLKYGVGVIGMYWDEETKYVSQIVDEPITFLGVPIPGKTRTRKVRKTLEVPGYQGNKLFNVRPQDFFPDPRFPMWRFQEGEFCGRYVELSTTAVYSGAQRGEYFNVNGLKGFKGLMVDREKGSSQIQLPYPSDNSILGTESIGTLTGYEILVKLVPKDWGLGKSDKLEMWAFTYVGDEVIIAARPVGLLHGKFPYAVIEYEIDGYSMFPRGMLEAMQPLQDTLSWLINAHFYNVRKNLNGEFLADPSMVVMKDFDDPNPGRVIRLRSAAYGMDVRTMVTQLATANVTQQHIGDAQLVGDMIQRLLGVTDNVMGMVNSGGRKTATEVRTASGFSINRLKTNTEFFSAMGFAPLGCMLLESSQQLYEAERKFRIVGDLTGRSDPYMNITPEMIAGYYDFIPVDGTMPVDRLAMAKMWQELMGGIRNYPQVAQQYDLAKIFGYIGKLVGVKNFDRFKIKIGDPAQLQQQAQAGNVVPLPTESPRTQIPQPGAVNG
jgi:hypothetical protein